jgi:hypothetical protein
MGFLITVLSKIKITIQKNMFFLSIPHPLLFLCCPSCTNGRLLVNDPFVGKLYHFIHPISFPSSFSISPRAFSPSLFLISLHPFQMCSMASLSSQQALHLLSSPSVQYLFSLFSFHHLNLAIIFHSLLFSNFAALFPAFTLSLFLLHSVHS